MNPDCHRTFDNGRDILMEDVACASAKAIIWKFDEREGRVHQTDADTRLSRGSRREGAKRNTRREG